VAAATAAADEEAVVAVAVAADEEAVAGKQSRRGRMPYRFEVQVSEERKVK
jgi:hypothetical protein